jgi:hypothetical protein
MDWEVIAASVAIIAALPISPLVAGVLVLIGIKRRRK